jgi:hypothetical protein
MFSKILIYFLYSISRKSKLHITLIIESEKKTKQKTTEYQQNENDVELKQNFDIN